MNFVKFSLLILVVFFITTTCLAETVTGCRIGTNDFLYTGYKGVKSYPVSQYYIPTFPTYATPTKPFLQAWYNNYASCPFFVGSPSYGGQCAVEGVTIVSDGWVQNLGNTITYTLSYNCPIDDWVIFLLFATVVLVFFFFREKIGPKFN